MRRAPSTFTTSRAWCNSCWRNSRRGGVYFDRFPAEAGLTPAWLHPYRSARAVVGGLTVGWSASCIRMKLRPASCGRR